MWTGGLRDACLADASFIDALGMFDPKSISLWLELLSEVWLWLMLLRKAQHLFHFEGREAGNHSCYTNPPSIVTNLLSASVYTPRSILMMEKIAMERLELDQPLQSSQVRIKGMRTLNCLLHSQTSTS